MDLKKPFLKRAVVWLISGLLVGALAADVWWRQRASDLRRQLAGQTQQTAEMESKLAGAEARIKQLTGELAAEQALRQRLEDLVNRGRK